MVRTISGYVTTVSMWGKNKAVFIDEADYLTPDAQAALRNLIEIASDNATFLMTANHPEKLSEAIHSRMMSVSFRFSKIERAEMKNAMMTRCESILHENERIASQAELSNLTDRYLPDMRKTINQLQCEFGYR